LDHLATRRTHSLTVLILFVLVAGCDVPPEARRDLPPLSGGPAPDLAPTASFDAPRAQVATSEAALADGATDLALRAERLRSEAEALTAPVLTDDERERLAAGG
jgi:hypothetical protein